MLASAADLAPPPLNSGFLRVVDVDGDGDMDIGVTGGSELVFLLNDGSQVFTQAPVSVPVNFFSFQRVIIEDMDGDGDAGVVASRRSGIIGSEFEIELYVNNGAGDFTLSIAIPRRESLFMEVGEFNGDALRDLAVVGVADSAGQRPVEIYLNIGGGTFQPPVLAPGLTGPSLLEAVDLDQDGLEDLVSHTVSDGVILRRALGGGTFDLPVTLVSSPAPNRFARTQTVDFDGDGDLDLLFQMTLGSFVLGPVRLAEQTSPGVFRDGFPVGPASEERTQPFVVPLSLADLNGDGAPEVISREFAEFVAFENFGVVNVGSSFCSDPLFRSATLTAVGSEVLSEGRLTLVAPGAPANVFGIAVGSRTNGAPMPVAGSLSDLCLTGAIGRYDGPGQVINSGPDGLLTQRLDLRALEVPTGTIPAQVGETWSFQIWHRAPATPGPGQTSRFTTGVAVQLR